MASEIGWSLLNPHGFTGDMDGGKRDDAMRTDFDEPLPNHTVAARIFGYGIVTWSFDPLACEEDYFRGRNPDGVQAPDHQAKRRLKPFAEG